jgi:hypothetical protein
MTYLGGCTSTTTSYFDVNRRASGWDALVGCSCGKFFVQGLVRRSTRSLYHDLARFSLRPWYEDLVEVLADVFLQDFYPVNNFDRCECCIM